MTQKLERQNCAYHRGNSGIGSATAKEETREISRSLQRDGTRMGIMKASDAAKAVVRRSTEEVQNRGNFEVSTNFSPTTLSITHRNQT